MLIRDLSARFVLLDYSKVLSHSSTARRKRPGWRTLDVLCNSPADHLLKDLFCYDHTAKFA